ncbi:unnamed protein product [Chrysoparadoxa australica]
MCPPLKCPLSWSFGEQAVSNTLSYTKRDLILFALGVGCCCKEDLHYLYEGDEAFSAFPTFPLTLPFKGESCDVVDFPGDTLPLLPQALYDAIPNPAGVLHYDQELIIKKPLATEGGKLHAVTNVIGIEALSRGSVVRTKTVMADSEGDVVCETVMGAYYGAWKLPHSLGMVPKRDAKPPARKPETSLYYRTSPEQAALYRLSGDYNPLHIDPAMSKQMGLREPILHGLCTFGIAARGILQHAREGKEQAPRLASMRGRFVSPAWPGDVLITSIWEEGGHLLWQVCRQGEGEDAEGVPVLVATGSALLSQQPVTATSPRSRL